MKTVILDIDRTLIHSVLNYIVKEEWKTHFEWFKVNEFTVFLRPHVKEFINFLFENNFKVGVFTASSKEYSKDIVDYLFKDRNLLFFFSSEEYDEGFNKYGKLKSIEYVVEKYHEIDIDNCILIDDSSTIKNSINDHCYKINKFVVCFDDIPKFNKLSTIDNGLIKCMEYLK